MENAQKDHTALQYVFYNNSCSVVLANIHLDFFHADRHSVFTRDFDSINVKLSTATIYYYGIDRKTYEPKITMLSYSSETAFISTMEYKAVTSKHLKKN